MGEVPGEVQSGARRRTRRRRLAALLGVVLAGGLLAKAADDTLGDPLVRQATVPLPGLVAQAPLRLLLISDIHVAGPDMPPERLTRIV